MNKRQVSLLGEMPAIKKKRMFSDDYFTVSKISELQFGASNKSRRVARDKL